MYQRIRQVEIRHLMSPTFHQTVRFERTLCRITAIRTVAVKYYFTIAIRLKEE